MTTPAAEFIVTLPTGEQKHVPAGTQVRTLVPRETSNGPVLAVRFNNKVASLQRPIMKDARLEYIDTSSRDGILIYRRSVTFLLIKAMRDLFPDLKVYINHSLNQGYYGEVYNPLFSGTEPSHLAESDFVRLRERMRQIVAEDLPFVRHELTVPQAIKLFEERGLADKVELLRYREDDVVSVYELAGMMNHFWGQLAPSTGVLKVFDVRPCGPGFVLIFPENGVMELPTYVHEPKLFDVYQEYERWARILGVRTVAHLNSLVDTSQINEYVLIAEALQERKLAQIADQFTQHPHQPKIILLSGPSSSGKTTTVKRLAVHLRVNGYRPLVIGLDDFFVERERTPKDEKGEYDFEAFGAIDVALLQEKIRGLLQGNEVALPKFDFVQGRPVDGHRVRLEKGQPLILEGIHALNPGLLPELPSGLMFKIYISPLTHLNIDDHNRIASSDARLIRRLVRDASYRGYSAVQTLGRWPSVRRGEERNIFPYQGEADCVFNSSIPYEVCVLRQFAVPLLEGVERENPLYSEAARLLKFMSYFRDIKQDVVPGHSLLREFIGGSSFKY
jgi:uridine kinase